MTFTTSFVSYTIKSVKYNIYYVISTGTATIMEKLDMLNDAVKQKSSSFLDQKQAEFDKDYEDFIERIAETRVRHCNYSICREYFCLRCDR